MKIKELFTPGLFGFLLLLAFVPLVNLRNADAVIRSIDDNTLIYFPENNFDEQGNELFRLERDHPAFRLNGCSVLCMSDDRLSFEIDIPGQSVLVIRASVPLKLAEQEGVKAHLRPGWDGTLGYSLYSLEVETVVIGHGEIRLAAVPVPSEADQSRYDFNSRISRFPDLLTAFQMWQREWREKLLKRLMNGEIPQHVPISADVVSIENRRSFILRSVIYESQPDRKNELLLALPANPAGPVPLLVALHGHEAPWGKADTAAFTPGHADDFCAYFASRGWAVLQPATMNHTLQHPGWTLQGEWTWDAMTAIDYAVSIPEVDPQNVMVCGLSTGGHLAMNILALDNRVKAGVVGCALSTWNHYRQRMRIPPNCDC